MYAQHNQGRGDCGYDRSEIVVVETTMKKEDKRTSKTDMNKDAVMEEVIILIVQMLNVTIAKNTLGKVLLCQEESGRRYIFS